MRRHWKRIATVAVVAAVALSVVAVAYGATRTQSERQAPGSAACGVLMNDPEALDAMQALRAEHQKEMQAWYGQYGSDPSSADAQAALQKLREEHWSDMRGLFEKFGIDVPDGAGPGGMMGRGGGCGGGCGGAGAGQGAGYGGMMGSGGGMMGAWN
ncbi:MAG: hypothetical protein ACM3MJ_04835 [Deltaproteobacteria bacterium]